MRHLAIGILLSLAAMTVRAGEPTQAMPEPPSTKALIPVFLKSGLHHVSTSVSIAYDQAGNILGVKIDKPTGSKPLDKAILAWAAQIKLKAGEAGFTSIPVVLDLGR